MEYDDYVNCKNINLFIMSTAALMQKPLVWVAM